MQRWNGKSNYSEDHSFGPTLYFAGNENLLHWQMPVSTALDYFFEQVGENSYNFTIITALGNYKCFCSSGKLDELLAKTRASMLERGLIENE